MSLKDLRDKFHGEARKTSPKFWNPKVGDSLVGNVFGTKNMGTKADGTPDERLLFYNYPSEEYFILPNHGHLNKQIHKEDVGKFFYIELASESLLRKGPGVGKMGKIYYVHELDDNEKSEIVNAEGTEDLIGGEEEDVGSDDDTVEAEPPF